MAVCRLTDKVYAEVAAIIRARAADDDDVMLDVTLTGENGPLIGIYASLDCPETDSVSRTYVLIDAGKYAACPEFINNVADDVWDALVSFRIGAAEGLAGPTA